MVSGGSASGRQRGTIQTLSLAWGGRRGETEEKAREAREKGARAMEIRVEEIHSGWANGFVRAFVSFLFFEVLHPLPFLSTSDA